MEKTAKNEVLNREIGRRVWGLRELFGMSRDELAERLGLSVPHIGLIERGQRGLTPARCMALSDIFCVSVEYIFTGRGKASKGSDFLPRHNLTHKEQQLLSEFVTAYSRISPKKRDADIIFEHTRFLLVQYIRIIR